jgi:tellurite resistance protein
MVKLQESELRSLVRHLAKSEEQLRDVRTLLDSVVNGTDWVSEAAETFKHRWRARAQEIKQLEEDLENFQQTCSTYADYAHQMNAPFTGEG